MRKQRGTVHGTARKARGSSVKYEHKKGKRLILSPLCMSMYLILYPPFTNFRVVKGAMQYSLVLTVCTSSFSDHYQILLWEGGGGVGPKLKA